MATKAPKIRTGLLGRAAIVVALFALAIAVAGCGSSSSSKGTSTAEAQSQASAVGNPPPEWAANADAWPAHNYDISNTRATSKASIDSTNVSKLNVKWRFALKGASVFGIFSSTPIVLNGTVYLQDLNSNVYALDSSTGKLKWQHVFNKPDEGPNGVAYGYGRIYGATASSAFALNAQNGKLIWSRKLIRNGSGPGSSEKAITASENRRSSSVCDRSCCTQTPSREHGAASSRPVPKNEYPPTGTWRLGPAASANGYSNANLDMGAGVDNGDGTFTFTEHTAGLVLKFKILNGPVLKDADGKPIIGAGVIDSVATFDVATGDLISLQETVHGPHPFRDGVDVCGPSIAYLTS
jgi:hypothetical protein